MSAVFILGAGQVTLLICLPVLVSETGLGYEVFAGLVALGTFLFIFSAPAWGKVGDRYGRYPVVVVGLTGFIVSYGLMALAVAFLLWGILSHSTATVLLIISRVIYGLTVSGIYPAIQAWVMEHHSDNQLKDLSRITAAASLGRLAGPVFPLLFLPLGVTGPLVGLAVAGLIILSGIVLGWRSRYLRLAEGTKEAGSLSNLQVFTRVWPLMLLAMTVTSLFGMLQYLIGPILESRFHYSAYDASRYLSILMSMAAFATFLTHVTLSGWYRNNGGVALKLGSIVLMVGCLTLVHAELLWVLILGVILSAASVALLTPIYTGIAMSFNPEQKGAVTGLLSTTHTIGYTLGALIAGFVGGQDDPALAVMAVMMTFLIVMTVFLLIEPEKNRFNKY